MFLSIVIEIIVVALIALVFTGVLVATGTYRKKHTRTGAHIAFAFIILFLGSLSLGTLMAPFGPAVFNYYFLPHVFVGLVLTLLLISIVPIRSLPSREHHTDLPTEPNEPDTPEAKNQPVESDDMIAVSLIFGLYFWILIACFLISIGTHYVNEYYVS